MSKEQANTPDDVLERATASLRDMAMADGPPADVLARTMTALQASERPARPHLLHALQQRIRTMNQIGRLATATAIVVAVGAIALWGLGQRNAIAFGQVIQQVRQVRTVKYKQTVEQSQPGTPAQQTVAEITIVAPSLVRTAYTYDCVIIQDTRGGTCLSLSPKTREAVILEVPNLPFVRTEADQPNLLEDLQRVDEKSARYIGTKDIASRSAQGFEVDHGRETVWVDSQTRLPVLIQRTASPEMMPGLTISVTMSDFAWDIPVDPSLVSLTPPPGYQVTTKTMDLQSSVPGEQQLVDGLRLFAQAHEGRFPDSLDYEAFAGGFGKTLAQPSGGNERVSQAEVWKRVEAFKTVAAAGIFAGDASRGTDWRYAGKGIKLDQADTPILWYLPKGAAGYHVIYADLSVRDVPPANRPTAASAEIQPLWPDSNLGFDASAPATESDLIRALKTFAEINDNRFPDDLTVEGSNRLLKELEERKGHMLLMEQIEWATRTSRISHGLGFVLPGNGSDWQYAGKGVALGQADTPVFWYRPKGADSYTARSTATWLRETSSRRICRPHRRRSSWPPVRAQSRSNVTWSRPCGPLRR